MSAAFTPGVWRFNAENFDGVVFVVEPTSDYTGRFRPIARDIFGVANARLIAAAPELYSALEHALGLIVEFGNLNGFRNLTDKELGGLVTAVAEEAGRALAKARGEAA